MRVVMTFLLALLASVGAWAQYGQIYSGFTATNGTGGTGDEGYDKLVDGKFVMGNFTKWGTLAKGTPTDETGSYYWVDFNSDQPIQVSKYILTTGNDNATYSGRNPKSWVLKGKLNENDTWTTIATVTNDETLEDQNFTDYEFSLDKVGTYKYFRFMVSALRGTGSFMQLCELRLQAPADPLILSNARVTGIVSPYLTSGEPVSVNYTVEASDGTPLTEGVHYTASFSPTTVQEAGSYTLTLTGISPYSGTKVINFDVIKKLSGSGTAADPYMINSNIDWESFVYFIDNESSSYIDKHYKLGADITVKSMACKSSDNAFRGTFDGDGHTMTLGLTTNVDYCAPFCYTDGAVIKRLRLTGNIETSARYAASIVASASNTFILNCWSSVNINSTYNGYAYHGGIVSQIPSSLTVIDHTLFDGSMTGADSKYCAGFSYSNGAVIRYCFFEPTSITMDHGSFGTFVYSSWMGNGSTYNFYKYADVSDFKYQSGYNATSYTDEKLTEYLGQDWSVSGDKRVPNLSTTSLPTGGRYSTSNGKEATWSISDDCKTLTFAGTGELVNYSSDYNRPTYVYRGRVTTVVLPEGITSIGNICKDFTKLTTVNFPSTLTNIGESAFYDCYALKAITIPATVTTIGNYAFYYCGSNKAVDVTLEHTTTVPEIQTYSFQNVTGTLNVQNTNIFNQVNDQWGYGTWTINCLNPSVDFAEATITGINSMKATGEPLEVNPKVVISGVEVDAANYTLSYTLNGNPVATIQEAGTYTVTATAKGSYTGTVSTTFAVLPANITYLDENGDEQTCSDYTILTSDMTGIGKYNKESNPTWYVAAGDMTFDHRITNSYKTNLILLNGATLNATKGIFVSDVSTFAVYAQSDDAATMGHLIAQGTKGEVAIGGNSDTYCGTIVINGGKIDATGSTVGTTSPAIGVTYWYAGSNITINGGIVTATSGNPTGDVYALRTTGSNSEKGSITINGGQFTAIGQYGIGGKAVTPINLGWKKATDFIQADRYMGTVTLQKAFLLSDGSTIATANTITGEKITPVSDVNNLAYATVTMTNVYEYNNGDAVVVEPVVKGADGTTLTKDTHYTLTYKNGSNATVTAADLKEKGSYTLTISAIAPYTGSRTLAFRIGNGEDLSGYIFSYAEDEEGKYYEIASEGDLEQLTAYVNRGHDAKGLRFKQTADITMSDAHLPIGCYDGYENRYFKGIFDGNNKTIKNLIINKPNDNNLGLFGMLGENALVKYVTVDGYDITGKKYVGAIAGSVYASEANRATIQNCHANGTNVGSVASADNHGGIVGYGYYVNITGCTSQGTISTTAGNEKYGGIIGYASYNVNITSCENTASITGEGNAHGGIVGDDDASSNRYSLCLNTGIVEGSSYKGAIAGQYYSSSNFTNCYYATPCTVKALNNNDYSGHGERGYIVTAGSHLASISAAETGVVESLLTGKKYYKKGNWTLTLAPILSDETFVSYACEGGTLDNLKTVDGDHKLTITDKDVTISALVSNNNGVDMSTVEIAAIPDQRWKGIAVTPEVTVTNGGTPLVEGTDYIAEATDNAVVGTATLTLTGINGYKGTATKTFNIVDFPLLDPQAANSESNPYLIADEADLQALASIVNSGARNNGYYKQTANITLTEEYTAIGTDSHRFQGNYNGDKKTISGLVINKPNDNCQGLFGYIHYATIKNVVLEGVDITAKNYVGGVAGYGYDSYIYTSSVSGAIKAADGVEANYHGGIVGYLCWYRIEGCVNTATVTGNGTHSHEFGGIAGYVNVTTVKDCFNAGEVTGTSYVGSVIGQYYSSTLTANYHTVSTTGGVGAQNVGTGTDQTGAEIVFNVTAGENTQVTLPETPAKVYNETNYYKNGTEVTLNYNTPAGKFFDQYTVSNGSITYPYVIDGKHILTGVTDNVTITGTYTDKMDVASNAVTVHCGIIPYTGDVITVAPVVTRLGVTLVQGTDYTVTTTPAVVQAAGEYTLTITGKGDYTGTKQATFFVKEATIIKNAEEWADFAAKVNAGTGNDDYYKLADDFDNTEAAVTATVGTGEHPFTGLFDGNGKTLNVNISETSTQGTAPFREIAGATIKNLTVSGSVTGTTHAAGLVGFTRSGVNYIENCVVNTNVTCSTGSNKHIGGVVGHGIQSTVNISNTVYTGVLTNSSDYAGGLLGWSDGGKLNITNCLVTASKSGNGKFHPIAIKNNTTVMEVNIDGAFYTNDATLTDDNYIAATGKKVYAGAQEAFCKKEYTFSGTDYYSKDATVIGNVANLIEHTGSAITVTPTVTYGGTALTAATDFTFVTDPATVQEVGEYTLTITGQGNYAGTQTMKFNVIAGILAGEGTEASPFIIASNADWNKFAGNITNGAYNYSGKFVQMTDNITVSTMAGNSEANSFQGTFLGTAGKTMTLNLTATTDGCAPFGSLKNATIKDLTIAGTVSTGFKFGASIAAHNYGTTHIQNCISTASITSTFKESADGTHGGFVALNDGGAKLYFNDCVFAGKLLGANATSNGGFVGYTNSSIYYTDCLFAPAEITMSPSYSCTFNRNGNNSLTRAYYLTEFGSTQGKQAFATENVPTTNLFGQITAADGNTYYVQGSVSNINDSYAYTGSAISINPTYAISNESVSFVKDTDFEVAITKDGNTVTEVNEIGDYVLTVSAKDGGKCKGSYTKNVNVYAAVPADFTWTEVTASSATLTWSDSHAANWTVELSESSEFSSILDSKNVTEKTVTFDGLTVDVDYYARVKAVYGEVISQWSPTVTIQPSNKTLVGSGKEKSEFLPFHLWYHHNLTQQIYTPAELGNKVGTILSLDFCRTDNNACKNSIDIYLVQTAKNSFDSQKDWIPVTAADKVFSGQVNFAGEKWTTITLDTPFEYDGTSNLALIVYDPNVSGDDYGNYRSFRVFNGASNQSIQFNSDNTDPTIAPTVSGNRMSSKNMLRIRFVNIALVNDDSNAAKKNSEKIADNNGGTKDVVLADRTFYKDGDWNTICLPFDVTLANSPLAGATAKTLTDASLTGTTVSMTFGDAVETLQAGVPYIIKWDAPADLTIKTAADWDAFASAVNGGESYKGKVIKLDADITVSTMAGTSSNKFKGSFYGEGHTMTLNNLSSTGEFCAPFRYVDGATITGLHTTGTVIAGSHTSNDKYRAGLIGESKGNTTINNCWSSVNITSEIAGDGTHGGFVGVVNGGSLTVTNSLFDGTISGADTYANGGFVGWTGNNTTNINNCLMTGTISTATQNGATFMRGSSDNAASNIKVNNSYYVTAYGTVQGTAVGEKTNTGLQTDLGNGWTIKNGKVVPALSKYTLTIDNPVFTDVSIDNTDRSISKANGNVKFIGYYDAFPITAADDDIYYMTAGGVLRHTGIDRTLKACRAYFQFADPSAVREFVLDFGDGQTTGIKNVDYKDSEDKSIYDLGGRKMNSNSRLKKGLYIQNGKKTVIK